MGSLPHSSYFCTQRRGSWRGAAFGRGNLSDEGLTRFCECFLETALDQVAFMSGVLELDGLEPRIVLYAEHQATLGELDPTAAFLLRDVLLRGEIARGEAARITGKPVRTASRIVAALLERNLLTSETPKGALRIAFPTGNCVRCSVESGYGGCGLFSNWSTALVRLKRRTTSLQPCTTQLESVQVDRLALVEPPVRLVRYAHRRFLAAQPTR